MAPSSKILASLGLGFAVQLTVVSATAQELAPQAPSVLPNSHSSDVVAVPSASVPFAAAPQALHRFSIRAHSLDRHLEIRSPDDDVIADCVGGCWLSLPNGDYIVRFYDAAGAKHDLDFAVSGPGGIEIEDAHEGTATTGLVFGIAGGTIAAAGIVSMTYVFSKVCWAVDTCDEPEDPNPAVTSWMLLGGMGATAVGAVMAPIGLTTWSRNRRPQVHDKSTGFDVAVVPRRDGAFLGVTTTF
jgi:hypothetical protein